MLWDYQFFGEDFCPSYDVEPMPNGNVLLCTQHVVPGLPGKLFEIEPVGTDGGKVILTSSSPNSHRSHLILIILTQPPLNRVRWSGSVT